MSLEQIIVLALIEGIAEFLPISSSGHLILLPALTGWPDQGVVTDMVTILGTVFATIIFFWRDVVAQFRGLWDIANKRQSADATLASNVIIGTIPILLAGVVFKFSGLSDSVRSPQLIAITSIIFGTLLYLGDHYGLMRHTLRQINWRSALIIGLAQILALIPGSSRSGVTMTTARGLGFARADAARFSFLLSIPANAASALFVIGGAVKAGAHISGGVILTGVLAFFIGLGAITFLMRLLRTQSFLLFAIYRVVLGAVLLGLIYSGMKFGGVN